MYWHDRMGGWGYGLMTIIMLLLLGVIIFGAVAVVRYLGRAPQRTPMPPSDRPTPEQLLAERFARGEIDAEEYRHRLDTLRGGPPGPAGG
ncbi:SHOCT domain-containing protein [Kitasatospora atroaurantiaca]|uniref:Putative membrane protein n=1 Tax=Kitasatospora atroaurantiaca TaxID=285545 RepID=A0A561EJV4_9ACTN|nr:SHOCT domain-containing protein [Kitasatospora atroaurantiaca]TWE15895.1 putative membrane protein [Kitasatospora atroaurantiaca]